MGWVRGRIRIWRWDEKDFVCTLHVLYGMHRCHALVCRIPHQKDLELRKETAFYAHDGQELIVSCMKLAFVH